MDADKKQDYSKEDYVFDFDDKWNRNHNKYKIITQYKKYLTGSVADLGCNSGYQCYLLAEFNNVDSVSGYDINEKAVQLGNSRIRNKFDKNISDKVEFKVSNLDNVDCKSEEYDAIISFHTLEHIYEKDLPQVLSESNRILKKGGYFLLSMPYKDAYPSHLHVNQFDEESLNEHLSKHGFEKLELYLDDRVGDNPTTFCLTGIYIKK